VTPSWGNIGNGFGGIMSRVQQFGGVLLVAAIATTAFAEPVQIAQQGRVLDSLGAPVTGLHDLTFSLYEAPSGGDHVWMEEQSVQVDAGYYSVYLGTEVDLQSELFASETLYLQIALDNTSLGRVRLGAVPYAVRPITDTSADSPILQTRAYADYTRRSTGDGGVYYFGGSETSNAITPRNADSIIQIDLDYFGEATTHNTHVRLQYRVGSGSWTNFDLVGHGQQGHLKVGNYPDTDYNSTPHNSSTRVLKAFNTTEPIYFRTYHFNGGTFYHNTSVNASYESGPSTLTLTELNAAHTTYVKR
jgi:hypothetical protein